jgi:hypothetical protein
MNKRLPKSARVFNRREKARIRGLAIPKTEQEQMILALRTTPAPAEKVAA